MKTETRRNRHRWHPGVQSRVSRTQTGGGVWASSWRTLRKDRGRRTQGRGGYSYSRRTMMRCRCYMSGSMGCGPSEMFKNESSDENVSFWAFGGFAEAWIACSWMYIRDRAPRAGFEAHSAWDGAFPLEWRGWHRRQSLAIVR